MHDDANMDAAERLLDDWLARAAIDPSVFELRPDYCAGLMAVGGLRSGPTDPASDLALSDAEQLVRGGHTMPESDHQVELWREAYRSFGAKPKRTRSSVDALRRRAGRDGLPRVNRLTDHYNAVSVISGVPIGVEDIDRYDGALRLTRAHGTETFLTTDHGEPVTEIVDAGEPIWRDDVGATCRRWNWRQTTRTALRDGTARAIFIVDALGSDAQDTALAVLRQLEETLVGDLPASTRLIQRDGASD